MDASATDRPRIIAVFGGNRVSRDVALVARAVATKIVEGGGIVLSGGDGHDSKGRDVEHLNVKDEANAAARAATGRWLAVMNTTRRARDCLPVDRGLVVLPEVGDRRNLLEASLSDACVVLGTGAGDGTLSELVSAVCLGRPVLLLADPDRGEDAPPWPEVRSWFTDGERSEAAVADVLARTRSKLGEPAGVFGDLVGRVTKANLWLTDTCTCLGLDADLAVPWISQRLDDEPLGRFPDISPATATEKTEFASIRSQLEAWLTAG